MAKFARDIDVEIVTVFAGMPEGELSPFARFQHERWRLADSSAVQSRHREDTRAARALGEQVRTSWLPYLDAIYRDSRYASDDMLFGCVLESDTSLIRAIADDLDQGSGTEYFVPLGVGGHVDHVIVNRAARFLALAGAPVWGYADLPYALDRNALMGKLRELDSDEIRDVALDAEAIERRWNAVSCYGSQLPVLFRDLAEPRLQFEEFANQWMADRPVDRFWRIRPAG